jgi:hypothetical protein
MNIVSGYRKSFKSIIKKTTIPGNIPQRHNVNNNGNESSLSKEENNRYTKVFELFK